MAYDDVWTRRFMGMCDHVASWSEDRDFQVGCVIVDPVGHEVRTTGYNGLPRGVSAQDDARFDRASGEKFFWIEHAERNAVYNAVRGGVALLGCTAYVNRFPCADCARALIQSGIARLVAPPIPVADGALDYSFQVSHRMLQEAGLIITEFQEGT
ncbi:deaminase [uncultured Tateyamaria sp.]|uniref:deoxycytidylate deaminase n=1 Tax=uncultured Tateyamaria sp. TaxID=455651 RepID=UPI0026268361|nr:deaminase [uncultured Tateyamaria sp.]